MSAVKKAFGQVKEFSGEVKAKLDDIREKDWSETTAAVFKVTGSIVDGLSFIPGASIIGGALKLGSSVLNPDPSLADLRRSENEIKKEIKESFLSVTDDMENVSHEIKLVREEIAQVMEVICNIKFNEGIEYFNELYEIFLESAEML